MSDPIAIRAVSDLARAQEVLDGPLRFGKDFADLMLCIQHDRERGWHVPEIIPYGPLSLSPAAKVLHYALEVFEGCKAYRWADDRVVLFRPELNARRLNTSSERLCLPQIPEDLYLNSLKCFVDSIRAWVPRAPGSSLYLRPTLIATEASVGLNFSQTHLFFVIASPVGPFFTSGFDPVAIKIEETQVRASAGGVGFAKTGANYAASLSATAQAKAEGFQQVLWLDAQHKKFIEELTGANIFLVFEDKTLVTPPLEGTILPGITRRSILTLASNLDLQVEVRRVTVDELLEGLKSGAITEIFATGTAAVITAIGEIGWKGERLDVGDGKTGRQTQRLYDMLTGIQYGAQPDPFGWMHTVPQSAPV